ncbi:MAG: NUDIX domain-containing protein [Solirubrobacterales bacterium]
MSEQFSFCPRCATGLVLRPSAPPDRDRLTCPACGFVHYENPSPTVQAWIDDDGSYLALERNQEPLKGAWNLPGGFVEANESGPEAIKREVREETGLQIEVLAPIGIFASHYGDPEGEGRPILDIAYRCRRASGDLEISEESGEARWFPLESFPEPAFSGERQALAALRS